MLQRKVKIVRSLLFESFLGMLDWVEVICPKGGVKGTISTLNDQAAISVVIVTIVVIISYVLK